MIGRTQGQDGRPGAALCLQQSRGRADKTWPRRSNSDVFGCAECCHRTALSLGKLNEMLIGYCIVNNVIKRRFILTVLLC